MLFHWIDTLKVRRQDGRPLLMDVRTAAPLRRLGGWPTFAVACIGSLYAGFSTNLALKVPYMASMFAFNAVNSRLLTQLGLGGDQKELTSAALVGVEVSLMLSPLEMVRIQGQNAGKGGLLSASRAVSATAQSRGHLGLWHAWTRGMTATMHRETKYCAGQFFLCAKISEWAQNALEQPSARHRSCADRGDASCSCGDAGAPSHVSSPSPSLRAQVCGAVLGGIACTVISHPDDVIKTRMQTHLRGAPQYSSYATFAGSAKHIVSSEGLGALYRGSAIRCLLRVPLGLSVISVSGSWMRERARERWGA